MKSGLTVFTVQCSSYSFSSLGEYIQMEDIVYNLLNWQSADLTILACAGIIYQLFSRISPLPRILHTWQKQPFIMEHLNTTWNQQHSDSSQLWHHNSTLPLFSRLSLAQNGAESQMLIWFQSNICVFNVEHLPSDKLILALIQFYISGEGRAEGTQYHLDKPHQFSSPITAPNIVAGIVWTFCCLLHGSEKAWSSYQFIMMVYCVPHYYILSLYSQL